MTQYTSQSTVHCNSSPTSFAQNDRESQFHCVGSRHRTRHVSQVQIFKTRLILSHTAASSLGKTVTAAARRDNSSDDDEHLGLERIQTPALEDAVDGHRCRQLWGCRHQTRRVNYSSHWCSLEFAATRVSLRNGTYPNYS